MRYLKIYENFNKKDLFLNLCNEYLVFLLDDGFELLDDSENSSFFTIVLAKPDYSGPDEYTYGYLGFTWDDVKSDFIPFIEMLKYKSISIHKIGIETNSDDYDVKYDKLEELEELQIDELVLSIYLVIKK